MFINFSNHPSDRWSEEQRFAAVELGGKIVDVPFPNIEPTALLDDVKRLALVYFDKIVDDNQDENYVIHVAGEMTFVYRFVSLCQSAGVLCVAATTERVVAENPDGSKTSTFRFVKFRPYF
jgi:hypothetical protein